MAEELISPAAAFAHPAWRLRNVLDVRAQTLFAAGHVGGAFNRPLPAPPWSEARLAAALPSVLLPPRHEPLLVLADDPAAARAARDFLRARGRVATGACAVAGELLALLPPAERATGPGVAGLWRPPAFLAEHVAWLPPPAAGPVLDLGAGSGRAAVWLAARGHAVTAIDRLPDALAMAARLAAAARTDPARLTLLARDLRDPDATPPGPWAAVLSLRFLDRALLRRLPTLLGPQGVVIVRTFRREGEADPAAARARNRLEPGELARLLPDPPFTHLVLREDRDPDDRPAAGLVARLRG